jgi:hypothetical protein
MELPKLDAPPSFDGKGRSSTNCGIGICMEVASGRVCLLARRHFAPKMRVWRRDGITASGQKTPILVAYRRLAKAWLAAQPDIAIADRCTVYRIGIDSVRDMRQKDIR